MTNMDKIYFITHKNEKYSYFDSAKLALDNGIKLIQLRMKNMDENQIRQTAYRLKEECDKCNAKLIMNDNADLAIEIGLSGVHIGQKDEKFETVKSKIRPNQIAGLTCNTFEHIRQAAECKADYIGLGPYRFTRTKENLSTILGIKGYENLMQRCRESDFELPVYAIGGIRMQDVKGLLETGVYGIAISSLIIDSANPVQTIKELRKLIEETTDAIQERK